MQQDPQNPSERLSDALALESAGRVQEALDRLLALEREGPATPELLVHVARALVGAERGGEAEARLSGALRTWPTHPGLHVTFAELRWQRGAGDAALELLEQAIVQHPRELGLRLVAADLLRNMERTPRALELVREGLARAPESAAFLASLGVLLDDVDRPAEALAYLRAALPLAKFPARVQQNMIPILLRNGAAEEALALGERLLLATPDDQKLIAWRATSLRLLGDARYSELQDYLLVRSYRLVPPAGFADIGAFNAAFARELGRLHHATHRPLVQSLRGGTQTERNLPADAPVIADFFAMLEAPIRDYVSRLDARNTAHPTHRRAGAGHRIAGSWSVKLQPGGYHTNHVHPMGWLSSAYYVDVPPTGDQTRRDAWLKFGEPGIRLDLPADHFVRPEAGMLVLFPSFFWHGTVPFTEGGGRLTAAFDVVPI